MQRISFLIFIILLSNSCIKNRKSDESPGNIYEELQKLDIFSDAYPKAFFFRASENANSSYDVWDTNFSRLSGIMGKVLHEEVKNREKSLNYFQQFKKNHPNQLVLLHFNGNARDPLFQAKSFYAGHWLYFEGTTIRSDLTDKDKTTTLKVNNARLFKMKTGTGRPHPDEIGICRLNENNLPDWNYSEQVKLIGVDYFENTITVERGCFGTLKKTFSAGKAYAAAHVMEGPWGSHENKKGETVDNPMLWYYNFATNAPKDQLGRICYDVLADDIGKRFLPGGELESFDGIEFDVLHHDLKHHSYAYLDPDRQPDCDGDTKPDSGIKNGISYYGIGAFLFCKKLRDILGKDKLILADGYSEKHVRAFPWLNGIESEGWPIARDTLLEDWSGGINRHLFWDQNGYKPTFNYINHRWWTKEPPININRLILAATVFTNSVYAASGSKPFGRERNRAAENFGDEKMILYDEIVMGTENNKQWLGQPVGNIVRLAKHVENIVSGFELEGEGVIITQQDNAIVVNPDKNRNDINLKIKNIKCPQSDLLLLMKARGLPLRNYPVGVGRLIKASVDNSLVTNSLKHDFMSWMNENSFESEFHFSNIKPGKTEINIFIEGNEQVHIESLELYAAPHIVYREFENGLVIANLSHESVKVNLSKIFPRNNFKRLQATVFQDVKTNNGEPIKGELILPARDALFLIKD